MRSLVAVLLLVISSQAHAADFDIKIDNFIADHGISKAVMKVSNNTGKPVTNVFIDCVFARKDGRAVDIGKAVIREIPSGGVAYDTASIATTDGVENVACRVIKYR